MWEAALSGQPTEAKYREWFLPLLASVTIVALAEPTGTLTGCGSTPKQGDRVPRPRHGVVLIRAGKENASEAVNGQVHCDSIEAVEHVSR